MLRISVTYKGEPESYETAVINAEITDKIQIDWQAFGEVSVKINDRTHTFSEVIDFSLERVQ